MITVHCVDTSGSMSDDQLDQAQQEVMKRFKPKDIVVLFTVTFKVVTDLDRPFKSYSSKEFSFFRGGTDATEVLEFAEKQSAKKVLYSDGWLFENQVKQFDEFVEIK